MEESVKRLSLAILLVAFNPGSGVMADRLGAEQMEFLKVVTSPRAAAMGECSINLLEGPSFCQNPGLPGVFHLDKYLSFYSTINNKYRPDDYYPGELNSLGFSVGKSFDLGDKSGPYRKAISFSLGFQRMENSSYLTVRGFRDYHYRCYGSVDDYQFSAGFEHIIKTGLGIAYKNAQSIDTIDGRVEKITAGAYDFGVFVQLPIRFDFVQDSKDRPGALATKAELIPSVAYTDNNKGRNSKYRITFPPSYDEFTIKDILPNIRKFGLSLEGVAYRNSAPIISSDFTWEKVVYSFDSYHKYSRLGAELGLGGIIFGRIGRITDINGLLYKTRGVGVEFGGLINWLYELGKFRLSNNWSNKFLKGINLSFNFAMYDRKKGYWEPSDFPLTNSQYLNFSVSF